MNDLVAKTVVTFRCVQEKCRSGCCPVCAQMQEVPEAGPGHPSPELGGRVTELFILSPNTDFRSKAALCRVQGSLLQPLGVW